MDKRGGEVLRTRVVGEGAYDLAADPHLHSIIAVRAKLVAARGGELDVTHRADGKIIILAGGIQEGLIRLMKGRTSFIIAHRLSTIRNADQVIVLHNRRIVETGTHESLMSKPDGFYAKLYGMQAQSLEILESDFT